jgi:diacylglycerol kinase family enzyme
VELFTAASWDELNAVTGYAVNAARDASAVVVAAGDNSVVNTVARAVWNAHMVLGLLPQCPCVLASAHGIPDGPDEAAEVLLRSRIVRVPVAQVGDQPLLVGASMGRGRPWPGAWDAALPSPGRGLPLPAKFRAWRARCSAVTLELHARGEVRVVRTRVLRISNAPQLMAVVAPTLPAWSVLPRLLRPGVAREAPGLAFDRLVIRPLRGRHLELWIDGRQTLVQAPVEIRPAGWPLQLMA